MPTLSASAMLAAFPERLRLRRCAMYWRSGNWQLLRIGATEGRSTGRQRRCATSAKQSEAPNLNVLDVPHGTSNVAQAVQELNVADRFALQKLSFDEPEQFYTYMLDKLKIEFSQAPSRILDLQKGPKYPLWLPNAKWNIIETCLRGESPAIISRDEKSGAPPEVVSREELKKRVQACAVKWRNLGIEKGDRVAVILPMNTDSIAAYLGLQWIGAQLVSIPESFSSEEMAKRLRISQAKAVLTVSDYTRGGKKISLGQRVSDALCGQALIMTGTDVFPEATSWDSVSAEGDASITYLDSEDYINILFSSGTTGEPKAIPWKQYTSLKPVFDGHLHQDVRSSDRFAWPTSLGWMMGPYLIFASLANGATLALYEGSPVSPGFCKAVEEMEVTVLGVIPSMVKAWRRFEWVYDWSKIKCFTSTGEASHPDDYRWLSDRARRDCPIIEYCGGTELGGAFISSTVDDKFEPSQFHLPAFGNAFDLSENNEVMLKIPGLGMSVELLNHDHEKVYYEGMPEGYRRHGDVMEKLCSGNFRSAGRSDDTMNLGGIKVSSAEIERTISSHVPGVSECAAFAYCPTGPEELVIAISTEEVRSEASWKSDCQDAIKNHLSPLLKVSHIFLLSDLPRNASNKMLRRSMRAWFSQIQKREPDVPVMVGAYTLPMGKLGGQHAKLSAIDLGEKAAKELLSQSSLDPLLLEESLMGNVVSAGLGQNPARQIALRSGLRLDTPSTTVNRVCGSGLKAIALAADKIWLGRRHAILAGGCESMSNAPFYVTQHRQGRKFGNQPLIDGLIHDGLRDFETGGQMGDLALAWGGTREEMDDVAERSYKQAREANQPHEGVDQDLSRLRTLKPAYGTTITAANASKLTDGAAMTLIVGQRLAESLGVTALAEIVDYEEVAMEPKNFGLAPPEAVKRLLKRCGLSTSDIKVWEVNEAFANVVSLFTDGLKIDLERVNRRGGAIAMGHPLGASGARIAVEVVEQLQQEKSGSYGIAAICNGGGGATAMLFKSL